MKTKDEKRGHKKQTNLIFCSENFTFHVAKNLIIISGGLLSPVFELMNTHRLVFIVGRWIFIPHQPLHSQKIHCIIHYTRMRFSWGFFYILYWENGKKSPIGRRQCRNQMYLTPSIKLILKKMYYGIKKVLLSVCKTVIFLFSYVL